MMANYHFVDVQHIGASDKRSAKVNITVNVRPGVGIDAPQSLSHDVTVKKDGEDFKVELSPMDSLPNRDFVIAYKLLVKEVEPHAKQENGSFVLVITPPVQEEGANVNAMHAPCDVLFMVDRSYSMRGGSLEQCARAIEYLLEPFNDKDGVQLITFDHDIESFDNTAQWQRCTSENKQKMVQFVKAAKPRGGTELERALFSAIKILPRRLQKQKLICLLTDAAIGDITRAQELSELIVQEENTKLFVLGVGPAVDRFAIQQLAKKADGVSEVLLTTEKDLTRTVSRFRRRLLEAGPIMQNLSVHWDKSSGFELFDMFPSSLPDLYSGQALQLCGRYKKASSKPVKITIKGNWRDGKNFSVSKDVVFPDKEFTENVGVQRTWAKFKIDSLSESVSKATNEEEAKFNVIALSFQNVLMSKYTSFVAEEEDPNEKFAKILVRHGKEEISIEGLKPSDKAKSILLRAAIDCNTAYTTSSIKADIKTVTATEAVLLIKDLNLEKGLELVENSVELSKSMPKSSTNGPSYRPPPRPSAAPPRAPTSPPSLPTSSALPTSGSLPTSKSSGPPAPLAPSPRSSSLSSGPPLPPSPTPRSMSSGPSPLPAGGPPSVMASPVSLASSSSRSSSRTSSRTSSSAPLAPPMRPAPVCASPPPPPVASGPPPPPPPPVSSGPPPPVSSGPPPPPPAKSSASHFEPFSSISSSLSGPSRPHANGQRQKKHLQEVQKPVSPWLPVIPWLSEDKDEFYNAQSQNLPQKAQPSKTSAPVQYSEEDKAWMQQRQGKTIGQMDLAFVVDETGSMGAWISQVQQEIHTIINSIRQSPLCTDVRVGLIGYRDHPPQDQLVTEVMPLTSAIKEGVDEMYASGGGDGPECMTDGLYEAVRLNWRPAAARVVILITDAPPHGANCSGDGFPNGCPCGNHWFTQAACLREMGIVCYTVGCNISTQYEAVYRIIANVTKGLYVSISNAQMLVPLITGAAETALDRQRLQELLLEVVLPNLEALQKLEDDDKLVAELLRLLRAKNVKLRALSVHAQEMGMHFEDLTLEDVQLAFDDLRRSERVAL